MMKRTMERNVEYFMESILQQVEDHAWRGAGRIVADPANGGGNLTYLKKQTGVIYDTR
jgi:hypothetical protein